ncbi:MAG: proteasome subunit alpha [Acidimicrobiales bacterium]
MSMPFYVAPEQFMKDKADFARKNIARGRPLVATTYADGVLICAENASKTLHKVSEIYDRIAFAGVGRYNEFDLLRRSGVQYADVKGYQFSREDVDARSLANLYAQHIGNVFTHEQKPLEVEILVAEVDTDGGGDQLFHILYDGSVVDEDRFSVLGGEAEAITGRMARTYQAGWTLSDALKASVAALGGPDKAIAVPDLEVAVLARTQSRRAFRRLEDSETAELLEVSEAVEEELAAVGPGAGGELAELPEPGGELADVPHPASKSSKSGSGGGRASSGGKRSSGSGTGTGSDPSGSGAGAGSDPSGSGSSGGSGTGAGSGSEEGGTGGGNAG